MPKSRKTQVSLIDTPYKRINKIPMITSSQKNSFAVYYDCFLLIF
jgi:hypothetical protein